MSYKTFNGKVVCPRCDGNGLVYKAKISNLNQYLYICNECEAMWQDGTIVSIGSFTDLSTYLKSKNIEYDNAEIQEIDYDWYKE